jgi:hypothetical protein
VNYQVIQRNIGLILFKLPQTFGVCGEHLLPLSLSICLYFRMVANSQLALFFIFLGLQYRAFQRLADSLPGFFFMRDI